MNTNSVAVRYQVTCEGKRYKKQLGDHGEYRKDEMSIDM